MHDRYFRADEWVIKKCTSDISRLCISRNWIYRGHMLDPIFERPGARWFFFREIVVTHSTQLVGDNLRYSLCARSQETIFREINL